MESTERTGKYGSYGAYKRAVEEAAELLTREAEAEPMPAPAGDGKYGKYGAYGKVWQLRGVQTCC